MEGKLYIVGTPIGNLGDMTTRAIDTLSSVDLIVCEDVSNSSRMLKHFGIEKRTTVYHAGSDKRKEDYLIDKLKEGEHLAYITDAGMPTISDPGSFFIDRVKKEVGEDAVLVIPGVTALTTAVAISGFNMHPFTFYGFAPHKKGRETMFKEIANSENGAVLYESVHRIEKMLSSFTKELPSNRRIMVARELTKLHEEVKRGTPSEVYEYFKLNQGKIRGEFVVVVEAL